MTEQHQKAGGPDPVPSEKKRAPIPFNTVLFTVSFLVCLVLAWFFMDFGMRQAGSGNRKARDAGSGLVPATGKAGAKGTPAPPGAAVDADFAETAAPAPPGQARTDAATLVSVPAQEPPAADLPVVGNSTQGARAALPAAPTPQGAPADHSVLPRLPSEQQTPIPTNLSPKQLLEMAQQHGSGYLLQGRHLVPTPPPGVHQPMDPTPPLPDIAVPEALKKRTGKPTPRLGPTPRSYKPITTNMSPSQLRPGTAVPGWGQFSSFPSDAGSQPAGPVMFEDPKTRSARRLREHLATMSPEAVAGLPAEPTPIATTPAAAMPEQAVMPTPYGTMNEPAYAAGLEQAISGTQPAGGEPVPSLSGEAPPGTPRAMLPVEQGPLPVSTPAGTVVPPQAGAAEAVRASDLAASVGPPAPERQEIVIKKGGAEVVISNVPPGWVRGEDGRSSESASAGTPGTTGTAGPPPEAVPASPGSESSVLTKEEAERRIAEATANNPALKPKRDLPDLDVSKLPAQFKDRIDDSPRAMGAAVGESKLTPEELKKRVEMMKVLDPDGPVSRNREMVEQRIAENWAERTALAELARQRGLKVSDDELNAQREKLRQVNGPKFDAALQQAGFTEEEVRREVTDLALADKLVDDIFKQDYDDQRLRMVFDSAPEQFPPSRRIRVAEIVKAAPSDPGARQQLAAEMAQIQQQAARGGDFSQLASMHSEAPTRREGGDLGWLDAASRIRPEMGQAIGQLQPGQVSGVVEAGDTLAVYKLVAVEEARPGFEGAKSQVEARVRATIRDDMFLTAQDKTTIRIGGEVLKPGESGGARKAASTTARVTLPGTPGAPVSQAGAPVAASDFGKPIQPQASNRSRRR